MIFLNIEAISSTPFALLSFSWTILFPWSSNTTIHNLALIWTLCGISSSLSSCWTYIHFSFHNPQVYTINSISCSTLSKLIKPLMVLSFNSPKPTKGLDALTRNHLVRIGKMFGYWSKFSLKWTRITAKHLFGWFSFLVQKQETFLWESETFLSPIWVFDSDSLRIRNVSVIQTWPKLN